jgi:ABC-2 type transport system permease protein
LIILAVVAFSNLDIGGLFVTEMTPDQATDERIGVVDNADVIEPILPEYAERFQLYPSEEAGIAAVENNELRGLLVLPETYRQTGSLRLFTTGGGVESLTALSSDEARDFLVAHLVRDRLDPELRELVANPYDVERVTLGAEAVSPAETAAGFMLPYFSGILLGIAIFTSSGYLLQGVAKEKSSRVVEILLSSVTPRQLMTGKVLGLGALGLTQILVWIGSVILLGYLATQMLGVSTAIFGLLASRPSIVGLAVLYFLLGYTLYAVLMGGVGALGTSQQESQQLGGVFTFFAIIPFMLGGLIVGNPNQLFVRILSWFPLTSPTAMLLRLPLTDQLPLIDIIGSLILLFITIPLAIWIGGKLFRLGLLIYGQRPSIGRIFRALAEA